MRKLLAATAIAALTLGISATAVSAAPGGVKGRPTTAPDVACMQSGIAALKGLDALPAVAKGGLPIADAVALGVTVRDGADISGVPDPIPFNVILADHRAGDDSLFVYPWCS